MLAIAQTEMHSRIVVRTDHSPVRIFRRSVFSLYQAGSQWRETAPMPPPVLPNWAEYVLVVIDNSSIASGGKVKLRGRRPAPPQFGAGVRIK